MRTPTSQTALVLLNKADAARTLDVGDYLQPGSWRDGFSGEPQAFAERASVEVPAHGVRVFFTIARLHADTHARLVQLMASKTVR